MYIKYFEVSFIILSIILILQMVMLLINVTKFMKPLRASDFFSSIVISMLLYIINSLILAVLLPQNFAKVLMFLFAATPLLTGRFAEYKTHKLFTVIQIFIIFCGIIYIVNLSKFGV